MESINQDELQPDIAAKEKEVGGAVEGETDGHVGWQVTLYTIWIALILTMLGFSFVMPFIPFYIKQLGVTDPRSLPIWSGLMITGSGVSMSLAAPLWGWLADRRGRKPMVLRAMFGGSVVMALMGLARNVGQLFGLRVLQGAITGTVSASTALVSSVVPKSKMGYSLGLLQMAVYGGSSVGPLLGGIMAEHLGYRIPFVITGAMLFLAGMLVLFGAKERFTKSSPEENTRAGSLREVLYQPGVIAMLVMYLMLNLSGSFVSPIFPLFVEKLTASHGQAASQTGLILAIAGLSAAVSSILVGRICDRYGHKRVLIACTALTGVMCMPQAIAQNVGQLLVIRAVYGFFAGGMSPAINAMLTTIVPREKIGRAYGLTTTASAIGWTIGPAIGGWAASLFGYQFPFFMMGGMMITLAAAAKLNMRKAEKSA